MAKSATKKTKKTRPDTKRFAPKAKRRSQYRTSAEGRLPLLLLADVAGLGAQGDVVEVSLGYARNGLIPRGLAGEATQENIRQLEVQLTKQKAVEADRLADLKALAKQIEKTSCTVQAKANEEGHLYGSVGPEEVAEQLRQEGVDIASEMVQMETPFKELGVYTIDVRLNEEVVAPLKVWVVHE